MIDDSFEEHVARYIQALSDTHRADVVSGSDDEVRVVRIRLTETT